MSRRFRVITAFLFPCAVVLIYFFRDQLIHSAHLLPECKIHKYTGLWCTGCGNTRSVTALLHGQLWRAVRCNPAMPFLAFTALLLYAETVIGIWNKRVKLLPRNKRIWWTILAVLIIFYIIRNFFDVLAPPL